MHNDRINKIVKEFLFFLGIIILTYYIVLRKSNIDTVFDIIKKSNGMMITLAIFSMLFFFFFEALNLKYLLNKMETNVSLPKTFRYSLIGFFFSGITPAASGGQPVEAYYMDREGVDGWKATLVLLIQLLSYKIMALSLSLVAFFVNIKVLTIECKVFFIIGFIVYLFPLTLISLCIFNPFFMKRIAKIIINLLYKIKIKKPFENRDKVYEAIDKYNESTFYLKKNRKVFIVSLLTSFGGLFFSYSVSFFVYMSFGNGGYSWISILLKQALLYATASWFPLPGAVGASEAAYLSIFGTVYNKNELISALLLNRVISFYLFIFIGMISYFITRIATKK